MLLRMGRLQNHIKYHYSAICIFVKSTEKIVENIRARRLQMKLTQEGLSERAGVPLPTLRKLEQKELFFLNLS